MRKRYLVIGLVACLCVTMSGCSFGKKDKGPTKEELAASLQQAESQIASLQAELTGTKEAIAILDPKLSDTNLSAVMALPDGNSAYLVLKNSIRLGTELSMEPNRSVPNKTVIQLPGGVTYTPSNNWSFDINNNYMNLTHKNGMRVQIKVYNYLGESTPYDITQTILEPYVAKLEVKTIDTKSLFVDNTRVGGMIKTLMNVRYIEDGSKEQVMPEPETEETTADISGIGESTEPQVEDATETTETPDMTEVETVSVGGSEDSSEASGLDELGIEYTLDGSNLEGDKQNTESIVKEYSYNVGAIMSGEYSLTFEIFYENDDNAPIQEELLTSCLQSLQINGKTIKTD